MRGRCLQQCESTGQPVTSRKNPQVATRVTGCDSQRPTVSVGDPIMTNNVDEQIHRRTKVQHDIQTCAQPSRKRSIPEHCLIFRHISPLPILCQDTPAKHRDNSIPRLVRSPTSALDSTESLQSIDRLVYRGDLATSWCKLSWNLGGAFLFSKMPCLQFG